MSSVDKAIVCLCHDAMTLRARQLLLEHFGYKVLPAEYFNQLANLLHKQCPDMLLMDNCYPGLDYETAAEKAKRICPQILAVVLAPDDGDEFTQHSAVDHFLRLSDSREQWLSELRELFANREGSRGHQVPAR
jgi:CheY-like chemotaxis protein